MQNKCNRWPENGISGRGVFMRDYDIDIEEEMLKIRMLEKAHKEAELNGEKEVDISRQLIWFAVVMLLIIILLR